MRARSSFTPSNVLAGIAPLPSDEPLRTYVLGFAVWLYKRCFGRRWNFPYPPLLSGLLGHSTGC